MYECFSRNRVPGKKEKKTDGNGGENKDPELTTFFTYLFSPKFPFFKAIFFEEII